MDELTPTQEDSQEQVVDWTKPAETLAEANDRISRLYTAVAAMLGDGRHYNDPAKEKADVALHPQAKADYYAWAHDPTRAEGL